MKEFIKCRDVIVNKKDIMFVSICERWTLYINIGNNVPSICETFDNETEARKELNNIYKQLQEGEIEWVEDTKDTEESQPKTKYAITLREFWESNKKLAIHCDTEEKANMLLKAFDKLGKKWFNGELYTEVSYYSDYKFATCYNNRKQYCDYDWYKENDYTIYEFDEVDLDN